MGYLIVIVALLGLMWLLLVRPQRRRQLEQLQMQDALAPGDEVVTAGGIRGYVRAVEDEVLRIEIAEGVEVRVDRRAIGGVVHEDDEQEGVVEQPEEQPSPRSDSAVDG